LVFQKLSAKTRSPSSSETRTISSTKPLCFFKIGTAFSLMVLESSLALPALLVSSTKRVNMHVLLSLVGGERNPSRARRRKYVSALPPTVCLEEILVNCPNMVQLSANPQAYSASGRAKATASST